MRNFLACSIFLSLLPLDGFAFPITTPKPPFFILAGDSTTATLSDSGGGWGDGFLNTTLYHGASGTNYGKNGATTVTFRYGGHWGSILSTAREHTKHYAPFVTIQFGHNDQKPAANISLGEYRMNLQKMAADTRHAGATPILVTPLSRRNYADSTGTPGIIEDLTDWRDATIAAAKNTQSYWIDLNMASTLYLDSIGPAAAYSYNLKPDDHTHLNAEGSRVFGGMVAMLIFTDLPRLGHFVKVDPGLRDSIDHGQYYWP